MKKRTIALILCTALNQVAEAESLVLTGKIRPFTEAFQIVKPLENQGFFWSSLERDHLRIQEVQVSVPALNTSLKTSIPSDLPEGQVLVKDPHLSRTSVGLERKVSLKVSPKSHVFQIPISAVMGFSRTSLFVYAVKVRTAEDLPVHLLKVEGQKALVISPKLTAEHQVVTQGQQKIESANDLKFLVEEAVNAKEQ